MSHEATVWAWRQIERVKKVHSLVILLFLADMTHSDGRLFPSSSYLAKQLKMSERMVRMCLDELEAEGLLRRTPRPGTTDLFELLFTPTTIFPNGPVSAEDRVIGKRGRPRKTPAQDAGVYEKTPAPHSETPAPRAYDTTELTYKKASPSKTPHTIPDGWSVDERCRQYARDRGFDESAINLMEEDFTGYYRAKGTKWAEWSLVWMKWVRKADAERNNNGPRNPQPSASAQRNARSIENLFEGAMGAVDDYRRGRGDDPPDFV